MQIIGILIPPLGFLVALFLLRTPPKPMPRSTYFLVLGLIFFATALLTFAWVLMPQAVMTGTLWLLVSSIFLGLAAMGFLMGAASRARSYDAFGTTAKAWMGTVPVAQLILIFSKDVDNLPAPQIETTTAANPRDMVSLLSIVVGAALFLLGRSIFDVASEKIEQAVTTYADRPAYQLASTSLEIQAHGLQGVLKTFAENTTGKNIDEVTYLKGASSNDATLNYNYEISRPIEDLKIMKAQVTKVSCEDTTMHLLLAAGATVQFSYVVKGETAPTVIPITKSDCEDLAI